MILGLLGFSSGVPLFLTSKTLARWLSELNISYTAIGFFSVVSLPYALKFLWAPCIDGFSWPWLTKRLGRRRSWLIVSQILLIFGLAAFSLFDIEQHLLALALLSFGIAFVAATQEAMMLAYQVDILSQNQYGPGEAIAILGYRLGMLVSGAGVLYLATYFGWKFTYLLMGGCVGVGLVTVLAIEEPQKSFQRQKYPLHRIIQAALQRKLGFTNSWGQKLSEIGAAVITPFSDFTRQPNWMLSLILLFSFKLGDNLIGLLSAPFYDEIGFTKLEIAQAVNAFGMWATILGGMIGGILVIRLGFLRSMYICGVLHALAMGMNIVLVEVGHNIPMLYLAVASENITSGMRTNALLAYQLTLCNPHYAATQLALLTSCISLGRTVCAMPSGWMVESMGWFNFFTLTCLANIFPLVIVKYLMWQKGESILGRRYTSAESNC